MKYLMHLCVQVIRRVVGSRLRWLGLVLLLASSAPAVRAAEEFPRHFVSASTQPGNWAEMEPCFQKLLERKLESASELEQWLVDWSELTACLSEERIRRYNQMTCHTDDPAREKSYLEYVEQLEPLTKPYIQKLNEKFAACEYRKGLDPRRYKVLDRSIEAELKLFRSDNIPLQTQESRLKQQYQKLCGAMTVQFEGQERTLKQMERYLEETDRSQRQQAWKQIVQRRMQDQEAISMLYARAQITIL